MHIKVLYEDNHLIAVHKPAGVLSQGDKTGDHPLIFNVKKYIKKKYKKPGEVFLGSIHRLDRPVSGVIIFARTTKALLRMNELFKTRKIEKTYIALTNQRPKRDFESLEHYLLKDSRKNKVKCYSTNKPKSKKSITEYTLLNRINNLYCLKINPITGRPHQIRTQLSQAGIPIFGDLKYGSTKAIGDLSIALHCFSISFVHPVKKEKLTINTLPTKTFPWNLFDFQELLFFD